MNAHSLAPLQRWRRVLLLAGWALVVAWVLVATLVVPQVIRASHAGGGLELFREWIGKQPSLPLEEHVARWHRRQWPFAVALAASVGLFGFVTKRSFYASFVAGRSARDLAHIRIASAGVLFVNALWEDLASTAILPRELIRPMGVMRLLYCAPGFAAFAADAAALRGFQIAVAALLLCAAIGWRTRYTLPAAAISATVMGGLLRQYSHFFHTMSVPMMLLYVLAFSPCAGALSLDAKRGRTVNADGVDERSAWYHFAAVGVISVSYVLAGLSKLQNGGLLWWSGLNLKSHVLADSIGNMHFDWGIGLHLASLPPAYFAPLGLMALFGELAFGLVPFSIWARRLVPLLVLGMHAGIFLLQNVFFFDLMVLLSAIFVRPTLRELAAWLRPRSSQSRLGPVQAAGGSGARTDGLQLGVGLLLAALLFAGATRLEFYPLSAFQMYSSRNLTSTVQYSRVLAVHRSGRAERARLERGAWALADGRWTDNLDMAFDATSRPVFLKYLRAITPVLNEESAHDPIIRYDIERWEWDFEREPLALPNPGRLLERVQLEPSSD